ncbi:MAG: DciA family protein [Myxococcaceae bacterium]
MAEFTPLKSLLPTLLAKLSRESGKGAGLQVLWEDAAGALIAQSVEPLRVEGDALVVIAPDSSWMKRIGEHASEIGARLSERTSGQLKRVVVHQKDQPKDQKR